MTHTPALRGCFPYWRAELACRRRSRLRRQLADYLVASADRDPRGSPVRISSAGPQL